MSWTLTFPAVTHWRALKPNRFIGRSTAVTPSGPPHGSSGGVPGSVGVVVGVVGSGAGPVGVPAPPDGAPSPPPPPPGDPAPPGVADVPVGSGVTGAASDPVGLRFLHLSTERPWRLTRLQRLDLAFFLDL